jgi:light-regulated signal transduction histidine kinase (bacteriophytochrome)
VDDLLAYSRVERSEGEVGRTEIDAVLERVTDDLRVQIEESDAVIEAGPLPTVEADEEQVELLLRNLVSNALQYNGGGRPHVEVTAEAENDRWAFAVADDGIGIDPEKTDRIFEVFKRLHHDDEYTGTGIGLSLCQEIVENHGGDIWVESEPGEGSTFYFTLPRRATQ